MHIYQLEYYNELLGKYTQEYYKSFDTASKRFKELLQDHSDKYHPEISVIFLHE